MTSRVLPLLLLAVVQSTSAEEQFSEVQGALDSAVERGEVAGGSILLIHEGEDVYRSSFGFADIETNAPFQPETPVVIASISKPVLGTLAFHLAQEGVLELESPITRYLDEFADAKTESGEVLERAPTMIELFSHVSGFRSHYAKGGRPWFADWVRGKPLAFVVEKYATDFPFQTQPGTKYAYSGIGTDVAARVLEVVSNTPRNELLVREFATPLGMRHTFYRDADSLEKVGTMPTRYFTDDDGQVRRSRERPIPPTNTYSSSGGAIISTAPDLARWLLMIRNGGLIDGEGYLSKATVSNLLSTVPGSKMAKGGLAIRETDTEGKATIVGHSGSSGTNCWIDFEHDIIAIVLTQTSGKPKSFRTEVDEAIYSSLGVAEN